ncbi:hypothetical protein ACFLU6_08745 [Acidobacteriota bacterium]
MNFHDIKVKDIFEKLLGKELSNQFADEVNQGIEKGLSGQDLHDHVESAWTKCKDNVKDTELDEKHNVGIFVAVVIK